jgi:hypothetical protein
MIIAAAITVDGQPTTESWPEVFPSDIVLFPRFPRAILW